MKAWRRSSSSPGSAAAATPPLITLVVTDGTEVVSVEFDQPVTVAGPPVASSLEINGETGSWTAQLAAAELEWTGTFPVGQDPGFPWTLGGPEPDLSPEPASPQNGITV